MLDKVLAANSASLRSHATAALSAVFAQQRAFHISLVRDGYNHLLVGDGVLDAEVDGVVADGCAALVAVFVAYGDEFLFDDLHQHVVVAKNLLAALDETQLLVIFLLQFLMVQACQLSQTHIDDGVGLRLAKLIFIHQSLTGFGGSLRCFNQSDYLVDDVDGAQKSRQYVRPLLGLGHLEAGASCHHVLAVIDKVLDKVLQVEQHRAAFHQGDVVHRKRALQLRELEQFVQHHVGHHVVLQHIDNTYAVLAALVADVRYAHDLAVFHQLRLTLYHLGLVHTVRYRARHNDVTAFRVFLNLGVGTQYDAAATGVVSLLHTLVAVYRATTREVGRLDILHQPFDSYLRIIDVCYAAVHHLGEVVCRHVGGHTHGDAVRAVHQQVGYLGGKHRRLYSLVVVGRHHIDGLLVDVGQHLVRYLLQLRLRVTHGRRAVTVNRAEVTLTDNQSVAHRPRLCHTHQGSVNRGVTVRVIFTHGVTHDTGAFLRRSVVENSVLVHRVEDAPLHRLQAVTHIRKCTGDNHRHSVVDIRGLHRGLNVNPSDFFVFEFHRYYLLFLVF